MDGMSKQMHHDRLNILRSGDTVELLSASGNITYQMAPNEKFIFVSLASTFSMTVTLPPVSECTGGLYHIWLTVNAGGGAIVTVEDFKDDAGLSDITGIATAGEYCLLYSNGRKWIQTSAAGYT